MFFTRLINNALKWNVNIEAITPFTNGAMVNDEVLEGNGQV